MSNNITIELCAEDRARLDRLAAALEKRTCDKCVAAALQWQKACTEQPAEADPIQQKLAETLAKANDAVEAPKNTTEAAEAPTPATTPAEEEKPTEEAPAAPAPTKTVSRAELRAKFIELSAKGLKPQATDIVKSYAQTIPAVPEDKVAECYGKLVALEG